MTSEQVERPAGHAFISYVREDAADVDRLQHMLEAAGIRVWRDTENLWPGQDWKTEIKTAITNGSLAFIACFSEHSQQREKSYQNEELILAVEQMRQRNPGRSWLIPVRFSECTLPQYDLGAGRSLDSIQRVDLFDQGWEQGGARLVAAVMKILGTLQVENTDHSRSSRPQSASISEQIKSTLLASDRQIERTYTATPHRKHDALQDHGLEFEQSRLRLLYSSVLLFFLLSFLAPLLIFAFIINLAFNDAVFWIILIVVTVLLLLGFAILFSRPKARLIVDQVGLAVAKTGERTVYFPWDELSSVGFYRESVKLHLIGTPKIGSALWSDDQNRKNWTKKGFIRIFDAESIDVSPRALSDILTHYSGERCHIKKSDMQ